MSLEQSHINGALLRLRREENGLSFSDMANRACMSVKQIKQLEEGGTSSFYSDAVKVTAAKKLGSILGLSVEEVFGLLVTEPSQDVVPHANDGQEINPDTHSDHLDKSIPDKASSLEISAETNSTNTDVEVGVESQEENKSKTPFWMIATLFVAALVVAALMQPEDEPAHEPAPPLQVVPAETSDAASAAINPASAASSETTNGAASSASQVPTSAASPVPVLSSVVQTASGVRIPASQAASSATRATPAATSSSSVAPLTPTSAPKTP